ncbi:MAG: DivIVA domain-containing protein [Clostridia bacterium]|nr:DivIVA domain-containing protein [Clostridia bacterium]
MPITVAMIEEKEFKTKMRGYDPVEVDEFLDEICDEMVALQEEIATLNQRLSQASHGGYASAAVPAPVPMPSAAVPAPTPVPAPVKEAPKAVQAPREDASEAAQRLLARAQKVYDDTLAEAQAKADEILKNADSRASRDVEDLEEEKAALVKEVEMLKAAAKDYRDRFLRLLQDQEHVLKAESALFE